MGRDEGGDALCLREEMRQGGSFDEAFIVSECFLLPSFSGMPFDSRVVG